ncbi:hypothetical protein L207DRAFT_633572 [Hyaloscypha variabilis F]|uniref:Knr4/Smi1-like domain-containing protein n=1 Tax=Hyaloscypha variabilis (strain UAMH 11265 / GT02V1 / F) TaxID=1149755 RepID=A0A2J6RPZ5_HYAVF|nr:hypothetical protein L207DRAFT_633572 [Hyaloscypha variabilis F]
MTQGTYSREEAVAAIRSFYEFFTQTPSLDPSDIEYPPPEGWPEINAHSMAGLNKTDDVIELLKHLPYTPWSVQIAYQTHTIDYTTPDIQNDIEKARLEGHIVPVGAGVIPEHVVPLTMGGIYGSALLLDTKEGTVTDYILMERPERETAARGDPNYWRAYRTLPVAEFFQSWIDNYRSLDWVTVPDNVDDGAMLSHTKRTDEVRAIYRAHGWPDSFRRDECRKALIEWDSQ